ncbi:MAG: two-component system response regulator [Planctomycetaceae bacterium]|nr:two-component system response regulator [Planctomycetaceae bacterium]
MPRGLDATHDVVVEHDPLRAIARLNRDRFAGVFVAPRFRNQMARLAQTLHNERILEEMPDGVVLLDEENTLIWANQQFQQWLASAPTDTPVLGSNFYAVLGHPEILGPDYCPFHTALTSGNPSSSTLRTADNRYFQVHAVVAQEAENSTRHLVVTVRDSTDEWLHRQKLEAIHRAGIEIADLSPEEVFDMSVDDRIELVKSNILHYTQDVLHFDVVEIRLLDQQSGQLTPLLSFGLNSEAAQRALYAQPRGNGVTGFVAATGKSYLCEDTFKDPLYLEGFEGAKSSLTVPLSWHDQVIGTFNVESPDRCGFTESDLQFLEIFARDVAVSLNTLELLAAQKANTAQESVEAIHRVVAMPVDEILNDSVNIMEQYIGHEPEVVERLKRVLQNARDIKQMIQKVGQKMTPSQALPASAQLEQHSRLQDRRVLVVDADEAVRDDAHALLERFGCIVETAHEGGEAVFMVRNSGPGYDAIIVDVALPDMGGFELLLKLKDLLETVPLILMTGFGYDSGHSIVKARREGLHPEAVLYKPFRLDQLVNTVETIIASTAVTAHVEVSPP